MDPVFPTNVSDFKTIVGDGYAFVDKTLMIKDIVSFQNGPFLFTRPRRFGKTMNLSMLHCFFDMDHPENRKLFEGLKVSECPDVMSHFGKYKVIHMDFSMLESSDMDDFMIRLRNMVSMVFGNFKEISTSKNIDAEDRRSFKELRAKKADSGQLMFSILSLSQWIEQVYGTKAVILIDEYDKPVIQAYKLGFLQEFMVKFKSFMESSLKTNQAYRFAVIVGVVRMDGMRPFGSLSPKTFDVFEKGFDSAFGFTESEFDGLAANAGISSEDTDILRLYCRGYRFGDAEVYNPFCITRCIHDLQYGETKLHPHWSRSGGVDLISDALERTDPDFIDSIMSLGALSNTLEARADRMLDFRDLDSDDPDTVKAALISMMIISGYLNATEEMNGMYTVSLPNMEVTEAFDEMMKDLHLACKSDVSDLIGCICDMKTDKAAKELDRVLERMLPRDHYDESVHKTFMSALLGFSGYRYQTELGSGDGFIDIYAKGKDGRPGILMELKYSDKECDLDQLAEKALGQIRNTDYSRNIDECHIEVGIAFRKHTAKVAIGNRIPPKA